MTQPQQPPPPQQPTSGQIVAAAAVGLALVAIEARIQQQIEDDVQEALATIASLLIIALAIGGFTTGAELLSRKDVHEGSVAAWKRANSRTSAAVESGYAAGAQLALSKATRDMKAVGHEVPSQLPQLGTAIDQILADIDLAYSQAQTDLQNTVRAAYDGVQGPDADAARKLTIRKAVEQAGARLAQRLKAAGATSIYQGASDAQNAIYDNFTKTNPYVKVRKVWRVTASDPCGMCRALDGKTVAVDQQFDYDAGNDTKDWRPVWRNLLGPPRHPHCRCQLELVTT